MPRRPDPHLYPVLLVVAVLLAVLAWYVAAFFTPCP